MSTKTAVVRILFEQRWNAADKSLTSSLATFDDVSAAIRLANKIDGGKRSANNPANFLKDFIRHAERGNANWPEELKEARITAEQRKGKNLCFEFVPYSEGQTEPFPDPYRSSESTPIYEVQGITISGASRELGRKDEQWLIQVAVRQNLIPTHLALYSKLEVVEIDHLQTSVKLRETEIDCLFLAAVKVGDQVIKALVTCEAKTGESILPGQIADQANAALSNGLAQLVIPMAMKSEKGGALHSRVYVCEFETFKPGNVVDRTDLKIASECCYHLKPKIKGI